MTIWMTYAILVGALALVAGLAMERAAQALRLPTRFAWLAALVLAIAAPVVLPLVSPRVSAAPVTSAAGGAVATGQLRLATAMPSLLDRAAGAARMLDRPLLAFWLVLSLACLVRFIAGIARLRRRRRQWLARDIMGTTCFVTPDIGPAVVAMPRARIVIPEWVTALDQPSLVTVIRHERQHLEARDTRLIVAGAVGVALMPWNPAVWLVRRRLRLALEVDCDARVLAEDPRVDRYGSLLLAIAQRPRLTAALAATLTESTSDLERRIDAMTAPTPRRPRLRAAILAATALGAIALACSMPSPDFDQEKAAAASKQPYFEFQVERGAALGASARPPVYPPQLRAANVEGQVIAKFVVDTNGRADMRTFEVVKSDHRLFTQAVHDALASMEFTPAQVGRKKVKQLISMPFMFSLSRGEAAGARTPQVRTDSVMRAVPAGAIVPAYPNALRKANIEGKVIASFVVKADGSPDVRTLAIEMADHQAFVASVREALPRMRFKPAVGKNGVPVAYRMHMPFEFKLSR
jgi:TonB family protein